MITVAMPLEMYTSQIDGKKMKKLLDRARHYHTKLGITYTNHEPRECYGDELFRQIFNLLMAQPWFKMDKALRKQGKGGIEPEVMQSAIRIGAMGARRLGIESIGGKTIGDVQSVIDGFRENDTFREEDRSSSRRLAMEMAYSILEALIYKLPTNAVSEWSYHTHYNVLGIMLATYGTLPIYDKLGIQKMKKRMNFAKTYASSDVHARLLQSILDMIPASLRERLMIPEIVQSILAGESFDQFSQSHLADFETEVDEKWEHHLEPPFEKPNQIS